MAVKRKDMNSKNIFSTKDWILKYRTTFTMDEDVMTGDISNKKLQSFSIELKRDRSLSSLGTNKEDTIG